MSEDYAEKERLLCEKKPHQVTILDFYCLCFWVLVFFVITSLGIITNSERIDTLEKRIPPMHATVELRDRERFALKTDDLCREIIHLLKPFFIAAPKCDRREFPPTP